MTHITLREFGRDLSSRARARGLRAKISTTSTASVEIDFAGVRDLSFSFADELLAVLVKERGVDWFRENIRLRNLDPGHRFVILKAIASRLERNR